MEAPLDLGSSDRMFNLQLLVQKLEVYWKFYHAFHIYCGHGDGDTSWI